MADENKKTWIKQGNVDATFPEEADLNVPIQTHSYCTTNNIIDNSGIFAIVTTKNGKPWDGVSNNIRSVYVYTTKDRGEMKRDTVMSNGSTRHETKGLSSGTGILAFDRSDPTTVSLDIPAFKSVKDAENYIKNGDWSNALNADSLNIAKVITRVYVDNSTPPNLKIVFDIDEPEDSGKTPPGMIWLRFWKTKDYADIQGATMFKQQGFQFGGNVSYTWGALELMGGGKDLAIETSTHADNSRI